MGVETPPTEGKPMKTAKPASRTERWETLFATLMAKEERLEELKAQGRYGYQLRMPGKAVRIAKDAILAEFPEECKGLIS